MSNNLRNVFRFLDILDREVAGRNAEHPPPEIEVRFRRLLDGEVPTDEERKRLFEILRDHPGWMAWLAEQMKARRTSLRKES